VNILVDTSVWSLALRRKLRDLGPDYRGLIDELAELIKEGRARIIGPVRQEILSGIGDADQYEKLRLTLRSFNDEPLETADYEAAAKAGNACRTRGIAVTAVDLLICTVALSRQWSIFTTDPDFKNYSRVLPITLYSSHK
jgi:predicted nucleic acid-binding protein